MSTPSNTPDRMTNYRWLICSMLFFATTVNYLDRQVLSLTWKDFISPEFHSGCSDDNDTQDTARTARRTDSCKQRGG